MYKDKVILITGASSGIGAALARRFARDRATLVLVARRQDRLASLADELMHHTAAFTIAADLAADGAPARVIAEANRLAGRIDVLVNNAGVGEYGEFRRQDPAALDRMMRLNTTAVVQLTRAALPAMIERRSGAILNIASTAAFQPTPYMAVYGGTKSFVRNFSLALWCELRDTGVTVTCVCPGPVRTEFFDHGGYESRRDDFQRLAADPDWLAEKARAALIRKKVISTPGAINWLGAFLTRFGWPRLVTRISARILGPGM